MKFTNVRELKKAFGDTCEVNVGNFAQRLWQTNFAFSFNPNVVLTSFVQYDNESSNVGANTPLKIARGLNALWSKGGLQYAPPVR